MKALLSRPRTPFGKGSLFPLRPALRGFVGGVLRVPSVFDSSQTGACADLKSLLSRRYHDDDHLRLPRCHGDGAIPKTGPISARSGPRDRYLYRSRPLATSTPARPKPRSTYRRDLSIGVGKCLATQTLRLEPPTSELLELKFSTQRGVEIPHGTPRRFF